MAQQALGAGTAIPRKRVVFGLLDADGWSWAGLKAFFWLIVIIFMLGYIPDRAYYLTVNRTELQLGEWLGSHGAAVALQAGLGVAASLCVAYASYQLVEKRILGLKRFFISTGKPAVKPANQLPASAG